MRRRAKDGYDLDDVPLVGIGALLGLLCENAALIVDTSPSRRREQCRRRPWVVLSLVRSGRDSSGVLSFGDEGKRRLNVSLTRAKRGLVVGGDWETLGTVGSHRSAVDSSAAVCAAHGDRLGVVTLSVRIGTESRDA